MTVITVAGNTPVDDGLLTCVDSNDRGDSVIGEDSIVSIGLGLAILSEVGSAVFITDCVMTIDCSVTGGMILAVTDRDASACVLFEA